MPSHSIKNTLPSQIAPNQRNQAIAAKAETSQALVLTVGFLLGLCLIGLTHADIYLDQHKHGVAVELGAGMQDQAKFEEDVNAAPVYRKLGFLGLLAIAAYCLVSAPRGVVLQPSIVMLLIGCCLAMVMASFFWSSGRQETGRELIRIVAYTGVAFAFARRFKPHELLKVLMLMAGVSVLAAALVDVAMGGFRPWSGDYRMHGTLHSNLLAHQALIALFVAFALYKNSSKPWIWKAVLLAMLSVIILTKTRGALASAIVGLTAIAVLGRSFSSLMLAVSSLGTLVLAGALLVVMMGPEVQQRLQEAAVLGRSEGVGTLTGRLPLWKAVLKESKDNRLKGYGYGAFWNSDRTIKLSKQLDWFPGHSHSAYIQTMLDTGYLGAGLILTLVFAALARAVMLLRATGDPSYKFVFGLLLAGLVDGIVEVSFVYPRELGLFVAIALFMLLFAHPQREAAPVPEEDSHTASPELAWRRTQPAY